MSDKTTALEEQLAYHDKSIEELSEMVTRQWQEIDRLKKLVGSLQDKVSELEDGADEDGSQSATEFAAANKPPHY